MKQLIVMVTAAAAVLAASASPAAAASDRAACVGAFSSFFAHGGLGIHRSDVAQGYARGARPAGQSVYSHVAQFHGDLETCFADT